MSRTHGSERNANFDYLRLFLASAVVLTLHFPLFYAGFPRFHWVFPVPDFIAISGYLVAESFRKSASPGHFFWKRLLRVGPAFLLALTLAFVLFGWSGLTGSVMQWATAGFIGFQRNINGSLWSLSVEEVLYVVLALLFVTGAFRSRWPIYGLFVVCLIASILPLYPHTTAWRLLLPVPTAFFAGNLLTFHKNLLERIPAWAATALLVVSFLPLRELPLNVVSTIQGVACVIFALRGPRIPGQIPDISYGLYIYHWPLLLLLANRIPPLASGALIYGLAIASWYLLEKPVLALKNRPWKQAHKPSITATEGGLGRELELPQPSVA